MTAICTLGNFRRLFVLGGMLVCCLQSYSQTPAIELTDDGTWCWFSDPRAIWLPDQGGTLVAGFVTSEGTVAAMQYELNSGKKKISSLFDKLETDDHNNPAFAISPTDGKILAFYTRHHNTDLYLNRSEQRGDAGSWEPVVTINPNGQSDIEKYGDNKYTYANPFVLSGEHGRIILFGRWIGFKPNMAWSDDGGITWSEGQVVISPKPFSWGQRPYVKYYSDGKERIHMVFTDGHPRDEAYNSVYYACYFRGAFFRADGSLICTVNQLPFEPREATLVYDARKTGLRAWVYDIVADKKGNPAIAYARYPSETVHVYHYAWFKKGKWYDREIVHSGKWFPQTPEGQKEREPHYSGGMSLCPSQKNVVYLSRQVNGVFEIEKWSWKTDRECWVSAPLTSNSSSDQIRPYVVKNYPRKDHALVLWNSVDRYVHYTDFHTRVLLKVD